VPFKPYYVITVGASLPVDSFIFTNRNASSAKSFNATGADISCFDGSFSYCSKYMRIVAPADPVPLRRNTTLAGSPDGSWKLRMSPCFDVCDPSTGSV
jgi:hypothetical protein